MAVWRAREQKLPLNITLLWELEEEIGSTHFEEFLRSQGPGLATDSILVSDTEWLAAGKPAIPYGLRGLITFEVSLRTAERDTHSGSVGGAARNPLGELTQIIAECYDAVSGRVLVPHFYDDVTPPSGAELRGFLSSGFDVETFRAAYGLLALRTTDPAEVVSRIMAEPTFEVHGISGGHTGPGIKTAIPPAATAKLSARLVPGQEPAKIFRLIREFITSLHPGVEATLEAAASPFLTDPSGPYLQAASAAVESAFGTQPSFIREGGTNGAVLSMSELLQAPVVMLGLSLPEHGYHAPQEHFDWHQASKGMDMFMHYFEKVAALEGADKA
jgi:acetylornithine deacetylase/succinyl-diaminopimelate desuccinylase-like protein